MIAHLTIHLPNDVILSPVDSACNLGIVFDSNISFSNHISAVSKSCLYYIQGRSGVSAIPSIVPQPPLLFILNLTIANLLLNIPSAQTNRLQLVLNSAARPNTKTPKFHHITPILKSLHWLKINDRIQY